MEAVRRINRPGNLVRRFFDINIIGSMANQLWVMGMSGIEIYRKTFFKFGKGRIYLSTSL
jgi:hypothetical protein